MAAIMTGRYPSACSMVGNNDSLSEGLMTLPELLSQAGYTCLGFTTNEFMSGRYGFDQGFDELVYLKEDPSKEEIHVRSDELTDRVIERLEDLAESQPFFLYVHSVDVHDPYTPVPELAAAFDRGRGKTVNGGQDLIRSVHRQYRFLTNDEVAHLIDLYDAEIAFNDAQIGRLLDELESRGLYRDLVIVVTSDHGEEFLEHGNLCHSRTLHRESTHVPLIVKWPDAKPGHRVEHAVRHVDILPTLCRICGVETPDNLPGRSLVGLLRGEEPKGGEREVFSELNLESMVSLRRGGTHVIVSKPGRDWRESPLSRVQYFHTSDDPGETNNLAALEPIRAGVEAAAAQFYHAQARWNWEQLGLSGEEAVIDAEHLKILEALGYVGE